MRGRIPLLLTLTVLCPLAGCGSKISEANYYRVRYGMTEDEVEDLLGPAHEDSTVAASSSQSATTSPAARKTKSWTRNGLIIRVTFGDGVVTGRSAEGIAAERPALRLTIPRGQSSTMPAR